MIKLNKNKDIKDSKEKEKKKKKEKIYNQKDILQIEYYDEEIGAFVLKDNIYMDMVSIIAKDLSNKNEEDLKYEMLRKMKFYKLYDDDIKIVSLNFPISTIKQKKNLEAYMNKTPDEVRKKWLRIMIEELEKIEKTITRKEYYLMYYANSKDRFLKNKGLIQSFIGSVHSIFEEASIHKKLDVMKKLLNQNILVITNESIYMGE